MGGGGELFLLQRHRLKDPISHQTNELYQVATSRAPGPTADYGEFADWHTLGRATLKGAAKFAEGDEKRTSIAFQARELISSPW